MPRRRTQHASQILQPTVSYLYISLDFGAVSSSVASSSPSVANDRLPILRVYDKWKGHVDRVAHVPTLSSYPLPGSKPWPSPEQVVRWGYTAEQDRASRRLKTYNMKLQFEQKEQTTTEVVKEKYLKVIKQLLKHRIIPDAESCIVDYLTELWKSIKYDLERDHGVGRTTQVRYILTVPINFNAHSFLEAQRKALENARMPKGPGRESYDIAIVGEPHAALHQAIQQLRLTLGDCITLVDMGGLTTDICTAKLRECSPPRVGDDVIDPEGATIGMQTVNDRLREVLAEMVTEKPEYGTVEDRIERLVIEFEQKIKRRVQLDVKRDGRYILTDEDSSWELSADYLMFIFDPVITANVDLILSHLEKVQANSANGQPSDYLILTGGGADCAPMERAIRHAINQKFPDVEVIRPGSQPQAVAYGAILQVLDPRFDEKRVFNMDMYIRRKIPRGEAEENLTREELVCLPKTGGYVQEEDGQFLDIVCRIAKKGRSDDVATATRGIAGRADGSSIFEAPVMHVRDINPNETNTDSSYCIDCPDFYFAEELWWTPGVSKDNTMGSKIMRSGLNTNNQTDRDIYAAMLMTDCKRNGVIKLHELNWLANRRLLESSVRLDIREGSETWHRYVCNFVVRVTLLRDSRDLIIEASHLPRSQSGIDGQGEYSVAKSTVCVAALYPAGYFGGLPQCRMG